MSKQTQAGKSGSNSNLNEANKEKQDVDNAGRMEGGKGNSQSGSQGNKGTAASTGNKTPAGSGSGAGSGTGSKSR